MALHYRDLPDNSVVCLMAPTASGKTDLAFRLYDTGRFELVSVDSALIYQNMNIGTAKPSRSELLRYPHALIDIISPTQNYDVASFVSDCEQLIQQSHQRGKIPLLVGGSMMYYMALFEGISNVPKTSEQTRSYVAQFHNEFGNQGIYDYLLQHDPKICQKLTISDTQRLCRAMEVHVQTGSPLSTYQAQPKKALSHNHRQHWLGLCVLPERSWLHLRIEKRLELMWQLGFVDEVIELITCYPSLSPQMPSMRCVGYRQVLEYLATIKHPSLMTHQGFASYLDELIESNKNHTKNTHLNNINTCQLMKNKALYATRQLAKRQTTWLRQLAALGLPAQNQMTHNNKMSVFHSIEQVEQALLG